MWLGVAPRKDTKKTCCLKVSKLPTQNTAPISGSIVNIIGGEGGAKLVAKGNQLRPIYLMNPSNEDKTFENCNIL